MKLIWDEDSGRYRRPGGQTISRLEVRQALDRDARAIARHAAEITEELRENQLTIMEWRESMREMIKQTHLTSTALAAGGRAQVTQEEWGLAGQIIREEYGFLDDWVVEILNGQAPLDGRMRTRAQLYAEAGRNSYHEAERRDQEARGMEEERSVLHPAEHCDDCLAESEAGPDGDGWRPIGEMIPIGSRRCGRRCKCTAQYRQRAA